MSDWEVVNLDSSLLARLAATMAQQSVIAAEAAKDEAAQSVIAAKAAKDEEVRDNVTSADINRETTPAHQPINIRALVAQLNAKKQLKGRAVRKDKNKLDHPSLTEDAKDCLQSAWLDGEVWLIDNRLYSLLCQLLGEAAEKTDRKQLVSVQDWTEVVSELENWTTGANKGPTTEMGPFQLALVTSLSLAACAAFSFDFWLCFCLRSMAASSVLVASFAWASAFFDFILFRIVIDVDCRRT